MNALQAAQQTVELTDAEFAVFKKLIYDWAGIFLPSSKKTLVSSRIMKRLRHFGFNNYSDYLDVVQGDRYPDEKQVMINLLTTNETYFFREPKHFDWLAETAKESHSSPFRVWSAACSTGQEVYTLAMVLADNLGTKPWQVVGSDISEHTLHIALKASYPIEQASQIPQRYLQKYCLRGVGAEQGKFCIQSDLLRQVRFHHSNLIEHKPGSFGHFDVIFLRNVMIYFDRETRKAVSERLLKSLKPGGFLVIGHAESLHGITDRLKAVRPTIYAAR